MKSMKICVYRHGDSGYSGSDNKKDKLGPGQTGKLSTGCTSQEK